MGYELSDSESSLKLDLEIVYFDIQQTSAGVAVFHKTDNETIIRIKGILYQGEKKLKEYVATGKSSEISVSTVIIDEGGGFNQATARSALKKTIITLIEKTL
jgi:predicted Zn-dependent protease